MPPLPSKLRRILESTVMVARDRELEALEGTDEWQKLPDEQWQKILREHKLGPVGPLLVGTEEQLLATLDGTPAAHLGRLDRGDPGAHREGTRVGCQAVGAKIGAGIPASHDTAQRGRCG